MYLIESKRKRVQPHSPSPEEDGSSSGSNSSGSNNSDDRVTGSVEDDSSEVDGKYQSCSVLCSCTYELC